MQDQNKKNSDQYISLNKAAKKSGYAQDYLSSLCRQGKLKGEKIGRNWVTTYQWLNEYRKDSVSDVRADVKKSPRKRGLVLAAGLFFIFLFLLGGFACVENFGHSASEISPKVAGASISVGYDEDGKISDRIVLFSDFLADTARAARDNLTDRISEIRLAASDAKDVFNNDKFAGALAIFPPPKSEKEKEKLKEKIELSFSDEVEVKPEDANSGIITPVFRESQGDDYFYLMVPVEE